MTKHPTQHTKECGWWFEDLSPCDCGFFAAWTYQPPESENWLQRQLDKNEETVAGWSNDVRIAMGMEPIHPDIVEQNEDLRQKWLAWCDRGELAEYELKRSRQRIEELDGHHCYCRLSVRRGESPMMACCMPGHTDEIAIPHLQPSVYTSEDFE